MARTGPSWSSGTTSRSCTRPRSPAAAAASGRRGGAPRTPYSIHEQGQAHPTFYFDIASFPDSVLESDEFGMVSAPLDDSFAHLGTTETLAFAAVAITALFCLEQQNRRHFIERH